MTKWPKDTQAARNAFYGDPGKGQIGPQMVPVVPPFAMYYDGKRVKAIQFHKKAAGALLAALNEIWDYCGHDQSKIDAAGVSKYAGAYNHRNVRGSATKWSNHAYAAAIDLNAGENAMGVSKGTMPQFVVDAFCRQGAMWGGWYKTRQDWMHFEFVDNGGRKPQSPPPSVAPVKMVEEIAPEAPEDEMEEEDADVVTVASADDVVPAHVEPTAPAISAETIQAVQHNLLTLGYHEVSVADGIWGSKTAAGIAAYKNDKKLPGAAIIDQDLVDALESSVRRNDKRLIPVNRATVTAKQIAPSVPAVRQSILQIFWAKVIAIVASVVAAVQWLIDQFHAAREYIQPYTSWLSDLPGWVWWAALGGAALLIVTSSGKVRDSLVHFKQTNRLN